MDMLASEYSSGCESGWTLYLEQSFLSPKIRQRGTQFVCTKSGCFLNKGTRNVVLKETQVGGEDQQCGGDDDDDDDDDEEEEDLSMVSDASSGPAIFHEDNNFEEEDQQCGGKRKKDGKEKKRHGKDIQDMASLLDDTASSPAFNFSKSNFAQTHNQTSIESDLEYSQGFSATYFEGRSACWENFVYVQPSFSGNYQLQNNRSRTL